MFYHQWFCNKLFRKLTIKNKRKTSNIFILSLKVNRSDYTKKEILARSFIYSGSFSKAPWSSDEENWSSTCAGQNIYQIDSDLVNTLSSAGTASISIIWWSWRFWKGISTFAYNYVKHTDACIAITNLLSNQ